MAPPDGAGIGANDQRRQLLGFDLGRSVGLELAPSMQMLAELSLCSQGEEVREGRRFVSEQAAFLGSESRDHRWSLREIAYGQSLCPGRGVGVRVRSALSLGKTNVGS